MNSRGVRLNLLVAAGIAGAILLPFAVLFAMRLGVTYPCPFKFWFGIPCPTCGTTRALAALASLNWLDALRFNPLLIVGGFAAAAGFILRERFPIISKLALPAFFAGLIVNWVYLILFLPR